MTDQEKVRFHMEQAATRLKEVREQHSGDVAKYRHYGLVEYYLDRVGQAFALTGFKRIRLHLIFADDPYEDAARQEEKYIADAVLWMRLFGISARRFWLWRDNYWSHYVEVQA